MFLLFTFLWKTKSKNWEKTLNILKTFTCTPQLQEKGTSWQISLLSHKASMTSINSNQLLISSVPTWLPLSAVLHYKHIAHSSHWSLLSPSWLFRLKTHYSSFGVDAALVLIQKCLIKAHCWTCVGFSKFPTILFLGDSEKFIKTFDFIIFLHHGQGRSNKPTKPHKIMIESVSP